MVEYATALVQLLILNQSSYIHGRKIFRSNTCACMYPYSVRGKKQLDQNSASIFFLHLEYLVGVYKNSPSMA
jgi:hypothetical protein